MPDSVDRRILCDGPLVARWYILYRLAEEMDQARRYHRPLSVALATPTVLPGEHLTEEAVASGAAAARMAARSTDLVGWLGGGSILIVMPETTHAEAKVAVFRWRNEVMLRATRKWRFAIIEDAGEWQTADELLQAARDRLTGRDVA